MPPKGSKTTSTTRRKTKETKQLKKDKKNLEQELREERRIKKYEELISEGQQPESFKDVKLSRGRKKIKEKVNKLLNEKMEIADIVEQQNNEIHDVYTEIENLENSKKHLDPKDIIKINDSINELIDVVNELKNKRDESIKTIENIDNEVIELSNLEKFDPGDIEIYESGDIEIYESSPPVRNYPTASSTTSSRPIPLGRRRRQVSEINADINTKILKGIAAMEIIAKNSRAEQNKILKRIRDELEKPESTNFISENIQEIIANNPEMAKKIDEDIDAEYSKGHITKKEYEKLKNSVPEQLKNIKIIKPKQKYMTYKRKSPTQQKSDSTGYMRLSNKMNSEPEYRTYRRV